MRRRNVRPGATRHRGFTLVEMLVAIGIIAVLLALTLVAGSSVLRRADMTRTQRTIQVLDLALSEWSTRAERSLSWGASPAATPIEWHDIYGNIPDIFTTTEALRVVARNESARELLASIDAEYLVELDPSEPAPIWLQPAPFDPDGTTAAQITQILSNGLPNPDGTVRGFENQLAVLDAWGRPIRMVHPGREWRRGGIDSELARDEDGTIRTAMEARYGAAKGRQPYFISAGPSGRFGDLSSDEDERRLEGEDNVTSYVVERRVTP